jgi:hypothetical protein
MPVLARSSFIRTPIILVMSLLIVNTSSALTEAPYITQYDDLTMVSIGLPLGVFGAADTLTVTVTFDTNFVGTGDVAISLIDTSHSTILTDTSGTIVGTPSVADTTAPVLSPLLVERDTATTGIVSFESDEAGFYDYAVVEAGAPAPVFGGGAGYALLAGQNVIFLPGLEAAKAYDVYITANDAAGNLSTTLVANLQAFGTGSGGSGGAGGSGSAAGSGGTTSGSLPATGDPLGTFALSIALVAFVSAIASGLFWFQKRKAE